MATKEIAVNNSTFEKILRSAIELPGVKINRAAFLRKELSKFFEDSDVDKAITTNPARAGLSSKVIEQIAKSCINYETAKVSALSTAAGFPGGWAMAATVPADMAQFFGHILRVLQKLIYLYGWQELFRDDCDGLDDETSNQLTLFLGVMFGINAANAAISKIAQVAAQQIPKQIMRQPLAKQSILPLVKKIAGIISVKITKKTFASGVGKIIPVIGAVASGGLTFAFFLPMAKRLQKYLLTLPMASANFYKQSHDNDNEIIDIDFSEIVIDDIIISDKIE